MSRKAREKKRGEKEGERCKRAHELSKFLISRMKFNKRRRVCMWGSRFNEKFIFHKNRIFLNFHLSSTIQARLFNYLSFSFHAFHTFRNIVLIFLCDNKVWPFRISR